MNQLNELLNQGLRHSPTYLPSNNSNHLPMTLCAISGLGGDVREFDTYRQQYEERLHEVAVSKPHPAWRDGIGNQEDYAQLLAWFRIEVKGKGIAQTVGEYLPEFIPSMAMAAFHPLIRLGYAIDFDNEAETAAALAYLVVSHREVPISRGLKIDIGSVARTQVMQGPRGFSSAWFSAGLMELLDAKDYPVGSAGSLEQCAQLALDVYRSTRDFFALHMVTATRAARICTRIIDEDVVVAALTGSLLASHLIVGSPDFDRDNPVPLPRDIDLEHRYKFAWSCLSEHRYYGDERYAEEFRVLREKGLVPHW